MRLLVFALPLLFVSFASAVPDRDPPADDVPKFQGTWDLYLLHAKNDGEPVEDEKPTFRVAIDKNTYKAKADAGDEAGTFKLTPKGKIGHIEFNITEGADKGKKQLGLYQFDGDHIRISLGAVEGERPKNFDPREATLVGRMQKVK